MEKGIAVDPAKIKAILEWNAPKDVHDIRSFMGLTGYYCKFIDCFSKIAQTITTLQRKVFNLSGFNNVRIVLRN